MKKWEQKPDKLFTYNCPNVTKHALAILLSPTQKIYWLCPFIPAYNNNNLISRAPIRRFTDDKNAQTKIIIYNIYKYKS